MCLLIIIWCMMQFASSKRSFFVLHILSSLFLLRLLFLLLKQKGITTFDLNLPRWKRLRESFSSSYVFSFFFFWKKTKQYICVWYVECMHCIDNFHFIWRKRQNKFKWDDCWKWNRFKVSCIWIDDVVIYYFSDFSCRAALYPFEFLALVYRMRHRRPCASWPMSQQMECHTVWQPKIIERLIKSQLRGQTNMIASYCYYLWLQCVHTECARHMLTDIAWVINVLLLLLLFILWQRKKSMHWVYEWDIKID